MNVSISLHFIRKKSRNLRTGYLRTLCSMVNIVIIQFVRLVFVVVLYFVVW